jgi:FkbM family methyltransferase
MAFSGTQANPLPMTINVDPRPYGACTVGPMAGAVIAFTRALPATWLGKRMSMPLRRPVINGLGGRGVDTTLWDARARLYPADNSCEKDALFTPQIYDTLERAMIGAAIDRKSAAEGPFVFLDIGANVGLYSLFVAKRSGANRHNGGARILAAEPQPGIVDRLRFNVACNPDFDISVAPVAVTDRDGEVELVLHARDAAGSRLDLGAESVGTEAVRVPARPLAALVAEAGFSSVDALKIDVEGAEHLVLVPFLSGAPQALLPRLIVIEDHSQSWPVDLYALFKTLGYREAARSRVNRLFQLG